MSTGLHAAREDLHLPHVSSAPAYLHDANSANGMLSKPLSLSPRTFGMEDLRDFCGPLGSFKTGLTPRVFSTGLTPRSGFTPRFTTGFTPRIGSSGMNDTNSFFSRNTGFSPPRQSDVGNKISPTGFTPKDLSGMKVPMRFPNTFTTATPQKMEPHHHQYQPEPTQQSQMMQHAKQMQHVPPHMQHMQVPHHQQAEMNHINMSMYDYMNRPTIHPPPQQQQQQLQPMMASTNANVGVKGQKSVSPMSEDMEEEDLDERRRMKNRERVRKCRKRKQDRLNFLEDRTAELEKENGHLKAKLARKTVGVKAEPLSEAQVKELRKKQNTTLSAYVRAYNESADGSFEAGAKMVWSDNAEIVFGNSGQSVAGVVPLVAAKEASAAVFTQYKIKNYTVQWKESFPEKCVVHWEIEAVVKADAAMDVPLTAPFPALAKHYAADVAITVHMLSHLTFDEGKIVEEIRHVNTSAMLEATRAQFTADAGKLAAVLQCLMKA